MRARLAVLACALACCIAEPLTNADVDPEMCLCQFVAPTYSPLARTAGIQGTVRLNVSIDSGGSPNEVKVLEDADPILREVAAAAVRKWRFCPTKARIASPIVVTFKFEFQGKPTQEYAPTEVTFEPPATVTVRVPSAATLQR